jgi:hypothetical protein
MKSKSTSNSPGALTVERVPCEQCGGLLTFKPGTKNLTCRYCGLENRIQEGDEEIQEIDLHYALVELANAKPASRTQLIQCNACGAGFKFAASIQAGECPFCGTAIVTGVADAKAITPKSLLPFKVNEQEAKQQFRRWLKSLWFAPNNVIKYSGDETKLKGIYIPYWTFDSQTETYYQGARGKIYYVTENMQAFQKGRLIHETRQVPKIEWSPVQGRVSRLFDDVLVGASRSLPRQILDRLEPWDLENLEAFNENYLSGFASEYYQVELDQGFDLAKRKMDNVIYHDIAFDIGGDEQRIDRFHTQHYQSTFKHCLLPVWSAAFRYQDKAYRFVINGRTGQVQGERPYSYWKIAFAIMFGIVAVGGLLIILERSGMLQQLQSYR